MLSFYDDYSKDPYDCTGYRYFFDGLLRRLHMTKEQLRFMPSPEICEKEWEIIDYCAGTGKRPTPDEVRGPCLLWCDAVLNRHWISLLEEAFAEGTKVMDKVIEVVDEYEEQQLDFVENIDINRTAEVLEIIDLTKSP